MKQTSNALTMLLKAYRAVFTAAFTKGLASAVVLTAGLAAGAAQAAEDVYSGSAITATTDEAALEQYASLEDVVITDGKTVTVGDAVKVAHDIEIQSGGKLTSSTGANQLFVDGTITVAEGGAIELSGSGTNGKGITGSLYYNGAEDTSMYYGTLNAAGTVKVTNASLQLNQINFTGATVVVGDNVGDNLDNANTWHDNALINAEDSGVAGRGIMNITNGSEVTINAGGSVIGRTMTVSDSTITMAGTSALSSSGSALIRAYGDNGTLALNSSTVSVSSGSQGFISAGKQLTGNGATFTVADDATLSIGGGIDSNALTEGDLVMTGGAISNSGTLNVYGTTSFNGTTLSNASGATATFSGSGNIDLRGLKVTNLGTINVNLPDDRASHVYVDSLNDLVDDGDDAELILATTASNHFHLTVEDAENIDLATLGTSGKVSGGNNILEADDSTVTVSDASSGDAGFSVISAANLIFKDSAADGFTIVQGDHYEAYNSIAGASGTTAVNVSGALVLGDDEDQNYAASANGLNLVINSAAGQTDIHGVEVQGGNWSDLGNVTVTSGSFTVDTGASATIKNLITTAANGTVEVGGTLTVNGDTTVGNNVAAETVTVNAGGQLVLGNAVANAVTLSGGAVSGSGGFASGAVVLDGGTLKLDYVASDNKTFTSGDLTVLKNYFVSGASTSMNGFINVGAAKIDGLALDENDEITFTTIQNFGNVTTDELMGGTITGIDSRAGNVVSNQNVGALKAVSNHTEINIADTVQLNGVNGKYATNESGGVTALTSSGDNTYLTLASNGGQVGAITLTGDDSSLTVNAANEVSIQGNVSITSGSATVQSKTTVAGNVSVGGELVLTDELALIGDDRTVTAEKLTAEGATLNKADAVLTFGDASAKTDHSISASSINVDTITIQSATGQVNTLTVDGNSVVTANELNASGATIAVGSADSSAVIEVDRLNLDGGILTIDPLYGTPAAYVTVTTEDPEDAYVGVDGSIGVGQNSVFVYGMETAEAQALLSRLNLLDGQSLRTSLGAVAVVDKTFNIASGAALYLDSTMDHDKLHDAVDGLVNSSSGTLGTSGGAFVLGENSAIVVTEDLSEAVKGTGYVISFDDTTNLKSGNVDFGAGSKIIFDSGNILGGQSVNFTNAAFSTITNPTNVEITAAGGLLEGKLVEDSTASDTNIDFKVVDGAEAILYNQSNPVKAMTLDVFGNADKYELTDNGVKYISYIGGKNGGKDIEATARMAVYAGAVQATYMAQQASTDAVADRLGIANPNSNLVYADNLQGGGIWLAPIYKNHDSDEFDAQGVDYGADIDLYGVALGADFTTDSGVRVGAYFNVGSGDADGQGVGDDVSNDFDYFGLGIYAGKTFGNFNFIADAGFTQVSNDIDQNSLAGKLTADTDTTAVTVGLRGEYKFETQFVDITPHVGVRYTNLDMDSYDAKLDGQVVATTDADNMQIFSIPFGVSFAKEFTAGEWSVKPVLDITLTANAGDTDFDQDTTFIGVDTLNLSTEVFDDFTYGGTLGVSAEYGDSLGFGINVHYVGSDAADEFGVTGNIRYMF